MHFAYRVGWPAWKIAARIGIPMQAKATVTKDEETGILVAVCDDFLPYLGIVTEAPTLPELEAKLQDCFFDGLVEAFKSDKHIPIVSARLSRA